jgi:predicted DNA-binding protein with PD1-like motif
MYLDEPSRNHAMKHSVAETGRVFIIRLEDGEVLHDCVERFAAEHEVRAATVIAVGGADTGSRLVVGPEQGRASPVVPMEHELPGVHELAGVGTIFPDETGRPVLHLHAALGRERAAVAGCVRAGVKTWHVLEVVLTEIVGSSARRLPDAATGFKLLTP